MGEVLGLNIFDFLPKEEGLVFGPVDLFRFLWVVQEVANFPVDGFFYFRGQFEQVHFIDVTNYD